MNDTPNTASKGVLFPRLYETDAITGKDVSESIEATAEERAAMTKALDLLRLDDMRTQFQLRAIGPGRYRLKAHLTADVAQSCVVTLDPIQGTIDERFEIEFWPPEDVARLETQAAKDGMEIPLDGPEPVTGGAIDVGHLAYEHLAAALDPYPRKPGASFDWHDPQIAETEENAHKPFAELARLKQPKNANPE